MGNNRVFASVLFLAAAVENIASAGPITYSFTPIDGIPTGINDQGQIVGMGSGGDFLRDPSGTVHWFDVPGGTNAVFAGYAAWSFHVGLGINNLGEIVGNGAQGVFLRSPDGS